MNKYFQIDSIEFELYQVASNDWCVSVEDYGKEREDYNLGSLEKAYEFILSYAEVE